MKFTLFGITHDGMVRDHNEDNFAICKDLNDLNDWSHEQQEWLELSKKGAMLIVADGMGGTNAGEIASEIAKNSVKSDLKVVSDLPTDESKRLKFLKKLIVRAHDRIVAHQANHLDTAGMGTTLILCWIIDSKLYTAWSGDSRCYIFNPASELYPFTDDHSVVWELVKNNSLSPEEARIHPESNYITQHLGDPKSPPKPEAKVTALNSNERILVCSDGLNGMISDHELHSLLTENNSTVECCHQLVQRANAYGGYDNITCILFDIEANENDFTINTTHDKTTKKPNKIFLSFFLVIITVVTFSYFSFDTIQRFLKNNLSKKNNIIVPADTSNATSNIISDSLKIRTIENDSTFKNFNSTIEEQVNSSNSTYQDSSKTVNDSLPKEMNFNFN